MVAHKPNLIGHKTKLNFRALARQSLIVSARARASRSRLALLQEKAINLYLNR